MKYLMLIFILLLSQCSPKTSKSGFSIREIDSSYVDTAIISVVKQYEGAFPNDSSIVLFFNLESDVIRIFGKGMYFTIGEFTIPYFEAELQNSYLYMPSHYFCMGNKKIFIVSSTNVLLNEKYTKDAFRKYLWLQKFYDKTKHDAWLVRYNANRQCTVVNKRCVLFLGIPVVDMEPLKYKN